MDPIRKCSILIGICSFFRDSAYLQPSLFWCPGSQAALRAQGGGPFHSLKISSDQASSLLVHMPSLAALSHVLSLTVPPPPSWALGSSWPSFLPRCHPQPAHLLSPGGWATLWSAGLPPLCSPEPCGDESHSAPRFYGPARGEERLGCGSLPLALRLAFSETADSAVTTCSSEICCLKHQLWFLGDSKVRLLWDSKASQPALCLEMKRHVCPTAGVPWLLPEGSGGPGVNRDLAGMNHIC